MTFRHVIVGTFSLYKLVYTSVASSITWEKRYLPHIFILKIQWSDTQKLHTTPLTEGEHNSRLLSTGCAWWLPFKECSRKKGKVNLQCRKANRHFLSHVIQVTSAVISYVDNVYPWCEVMRMALNLCGLPPQKNNPSLTVWKTLDKSQLRKILQNIWPVHLKTIKVIKIQASLKNCHRRKRDNKCNMVSRMKSWDEKKKKIR